MGEWSFEHSIFTVAPRPDAWRYWSDIHNHAKHEPGVERIELDGAFETGTTGRTIAVGFVQEWTLTEVVDRRRFVITGLTADGAGALSFGWEFEDEGTGTRMTQRIVARGPDVEKHMDVLRGMEASAPEAMERLAAELDRMTRSQLAEQ